MPTRFHLLSGRSLGVASVRRPLLPPCTRVTAGTRSDTRGCLLSRGEGCPCPTSPPASHFPAPASHLPAPTLWPGFALACPGAAPSRRRERPRRPHSLLPPHPDTPSSTRPLVGPCCGAAQGPNPQQKRGFDRLAVLGSRCSPGHGGAEAPLDAPGLAQETDSYPRCRQSLDGWLQVPITLPRATPTAPGRAPTPSMAPGGVSAPAPAPPGAFLGLQGQGPCCLSPPQPHPAGARMNQPRSFGEQELTPVWRGHVSLREPAKTHALWREGTKKWSGGLFFFLKKEKVADSVLLLSARNVFPGASPRSER